MLSNDIVPTGLLYSDSEMAWKAIQLFVLIYAVGLVVPLAFGGVQCSPLWLFACCTRGVPWE